MRLALIPPTPHLDLGFTDIHLLLAHLCDDPKYLQYYRGRSLRGDHLTLDNSAYEQHGASAGGMAEILALSYYVQIDEVVAPDWIKNERKTYAYMLDSVAFLQSNAGQKA